MTVILVRHCFAASNLRTRVCKFFQVCVCVCVPTTSEELRSDGGNELALERLGEVALGVLDRDAPLFEPTQQPQEVAVAQQVRRLELPVEVQKHLFKMKAFRRHNRTTTLAS